MCGHEAAPAREQRLLARLLRVVRLAKERNLEAVDPVAELREHRDQQRVGDHHRREDAESGADPQLGHEVEAEEGEPRDGDRDGQPCEENRAACRSARLGGGVTRR